MDPVSPEELLGRVKDLRLTVFPKIEGALAAATKDPVLGCSTTLTVDGPGGEVRVRADSLQVLQGPDKEADREKILEKVGEKLLETARYPEIRYRFRLDEETVEGIRLLGELEFKGRSLAIELHVHEVSAVSYGADFTLTHSELGIKPLSVFFGALKGGEKIRFRAEADLSP